MIIEITDIPRHSKIKKINFEIEFDDLEEPILPEISRERKGIPNEMTDSEF